MTVAQALDDRLTWLLDAIAQPPSLTEPEVAAAAVTGLDPTGLLAWLSGQVAGFQVVSRTVADDNVGVVRVRCPNERDWSLTVTVEQAEPHRIQGVQVDRVLPEGMEVRPAGPEDSDAIAQVCRNTEIVLRDCAVTIDPGPDYWAAIRLMEVPNVLVATDHGRVVAVHCGVAYPITFGGERQDMSQILHSRVLKEYAGLGLWSVMNKILVRASDEKRQEAASTGGIMRNGCAYFASDNDSARRLNGAQFPWSFSPLRAVISCDALAAGEPALAGRAGSPAEAADIAATLNECHEGEELFVPYTEATLADRLERAADAYTWSDLLVSDNAVVGVWNAGRIHTKRSLEGSDPPRSSVRGLVLDFGFRLGAEAELVGLLRTAAARSKAAGMTHLSIFTSNSSPASSLLLGLAEEVEQYELSTPYTPEPEGAADRGLYVDQVYF